MAIEKIVPEGPKFGFNERVKSTFAKANLLCQVSAHFKAHIIDLDLYSEVITAK